MGSKTPSPVDRRVLRTRRALRDALIALLHERAWDEISVQDICDRADVGRSTFYIHFADKEELLVGGFDNLRKLLLSQASLPQRASTPLGFARGLIDHAYENQRLFRALVGKRTGQVVQQRFRELVVALVKEDLASPSRAKPALDAAAEFIAGGFLGLLTWWLEGRAVLAPQDIERMFLDMSASAVAVARQGYRSSSDTALRSRG